MDASLRILDTPLRPIGARLFPEFARLLPSVSAWGTDRDTDFNWYELESAGLNESETRQFLRLHTHR